MIPTRHKAVQVDFDNAEARLRVRNMDVFDDHDLANSLTQGLGLPATALPPNGIPPIFPVRAKVSFDIEWNGAIDMAQITNTSEHFKGTFFSTQTTIKWSSEQDGFSFESEPPNPARNLLSVLGREQNGVFFT
jgi:hypothetical protein